MAKRIIVVGDDAFSQPPKRAGIGPIESSIGDTFDTIGRGGKWLNEQIQKGTGNLVDAAGQSFPSESGYDTRMRTGAAALGTAAGTASKYMLPDNAESAAAAMFGGLAAPASATKELAISKSIPFKKPGMWDKIRGSMLSAKTAIQPKYAEAIATDPSIMGPGTVDKKTVGTMYEELNKNLGANTNSETYKRLFGSAYPATEREFGRLKKMVEGAIEKIQTNPAAASTEELIFARQAARKLGESSAAKLDPRVASVADGHYSVLDDALSARGGESMKKLDQLYFRAAAKEAGSQVLPMNKNQSPNALRTNLMGLLAGSSLKNFGKGEFSAAAVDAAQAALMSPVVATSMLGSKLGNISPRAARGLGSLAQYKSKDDE